MASAGADESIAGDAWYSITLTNFHKGSHRVIFMQVMEFLTHSMAEQFGARSHWGKLFALSPEQIRPLYPRLDEFCRICVTHDPRGQFGNEWTAGLFRRRDNGV